MAYYFNSLTTLRRSPIQISAVPQPPGPYWAATVWSNGAGYTWDEHYLSLAGVGRGGGMPAHGMSEASSCMGGQGPKCCLESQALHHPGGRVRAGVGWEGDWTEHQQSGGWASGWVSLRCSCHRPGISGWTEVQGYKGGSVNSLTGSRVSQKTMNGKWSITLLILLQIFIFPLRQSLCFSCYFS